MRLRFDVVRALACGCPHLAMAYIVSRRTGRNP